MLRVLYKRFSCGLSAGDLIHKTIDELNEFTRPFAERLMDEAINTAMKGKSIE